MRFLTTLPDQIHFHSDAKPLADKWVFYENINPAFRIVSPSPNPWDKEWVALATCQKFRINGISVFSRMDLTLYDPNALYYPPGNVLHLPLIRETYFGQYGFNHLPCIPLFFAPSTSNQLDCQNLWISYYLKLPHSDVNISDFVVIEYRLQPGNCAINSLFHC